METGFALALLEHSPDALLLLDQDGSICFLNAAAVQLFGYTRGQLMGAEHSLLLAEASREPFHIVLSGLAASGTAAAPPSRPTSGPPSGPSSGPPSGPFKGAGRRADGTPFPVEITCSLVPG